MQKTWLWAGLGMGLLLLAASFWLTLWLGLNAVFQIPAQTALLVSIRSQRLNQSLTSEQKKQLPEAWREALRQSSAWPVILGAYREQDAWRYFSVTPRWQPADPGLMQIRRGFFTLTQDVPFPSAQRSFRYTDSLGWWWRHPLAVLTLWIDPKQALLPAPDSPEATWPVPSFTAAYQNHLLITDIPWPKNPPPAVLTNADLSFDLPESTDAEALGSVLLSRLPIGDLTLADLHPGPMQFNAWLDQHLAPQAMSIVYREPIPLGLAKLLLGSLGVTQNHPGKLPDGTLVTELTLLDATSTRDLWGKRTTRRYGNVTLDKNSLQIGQSTSSPQLIHSHCTNFTPWLRLSGKMLDALLQTVGKLTSLTHLPAISFGSSQEHLALCKDE